MSYEDTLRRLGNTTEQSLIHIWGQRRAGEISARVAIDLMETVVMVANAQGEAFGTLSFQAFMQTSTGAALPVEGKVRTMTAEARAMTREAIREALGKQPDARELALRRLGFNAPVREATESFRLAMVKDSRVSTYTRGLEATACTLCFYLYKDGYPYPITQTMHRHPGCVCSQVPNIRSDNDEQSTEQQRAAAAAEQRYEARERIGK